MLLDTAKITESKRIDPTVYLEGMGFMVRKEGRHLSVRAGQEEHYRITQKNDGHWVACDKIGNGIGDNIALVRDLEPSLGFVEAVERLTTGPVIQREPIAVIPRGGPVPPTCPRPAPPVRPVGSICKGEGFHPPRWIMPNARVSYATPRAGCCSWVGIPGVGCAT